MANNTTVVLRKTYKSYYCTRLNTYTQTVKPDNKTTMHLLVTIGNFQSLRQVERGFSDHGT